MRARRLYDVEEMKVVRTAVVPGTACDKNVYTTRKLAATVAAAGRKRGENVHHYRCDSCHGFHVGHRRGEPRLLADVREPSPGGPKLRSSNGEEGSGAVSRRLRSERHDDHRVPVQAGSPA